jgi:hypothetical protein
MYEGKAVVFDLRWSMERNDDIPFVVAVAGKALQSEIRLRSRRGTIFRMRAWSID